MRPKTADATAAAKVGEALTALAPDQLNTARLAQGKWADSVRMTKQLNDLGWFGNPSQAIASAAKGTAPGARTVYSDAGRKAMEDLANAGPSKFSEMAQNLGALGINHGVSAGIGALGGGALGHATLGAILGATQGTGKADVGKSIMQAYNTRAAKRALEAAIAATSTGQPATADMFRSAPWLRQAARQGVYGYGASGGGS